MNAMKHWHPVLLSDDLGSTPALVELHGNEIAVFRTESGEVGALEERCPHRRMRLSRGNVVGDQLACAYHGWRYGRDGEGCSPGNPELKVCAKSYEALERHGAIWLRARGDNTAFPEFDLHGFEHVISYGFHIQTPMELVLDNFTEVEHTGPTHALLGYESNRMHEVIVEVESTDETVRVQNFGPQKELPWIVEKLLGVRRGDVFVDDWTTYFSPVYTQYEHWWKDRETNEISRDHLRTFVFFVPVDKDKTRLFVFAYIRKGRRNPWVQKFILNPIIRRLLCHEVELDIQMIESLADQNTELSGMRLSRFDRVLGLNRDRLGAIYYGDSSP